MALTPVVLFDVDGQLLQRLEAALGPPLDSYLTGWQVWLVPVADLDPLAAADDPSLGDAELEFRLHPPAGFEQPAGLSHHDLWDAVISQLPPHPPAPPGQLQLGRERRSVAAVWVLLEIFPAFGESIAPAALRAWTEPLLGRAAVGAGEVDHDRLGGRWRRRGHASDLPGALREALGG